MKRRNFFALLFAPIVARFWPKPITEVVNEGLNPAWNGMVPVVEFWPKPTGEVFFLFKWGVHSSKYGIISHQVSPYWHGQPPLVMLNVQQPYPWDQDASQDHHQA